MGEGASPQDALLNVYRRDPRRAAEQWRVANRSRWNSNAGQQEVGV